VRDASWDDDRLARSGHELSTVEGEVGFARQDGEALLLVRMDVLGEHAAGHAAPSEPDQLPGAVRRVAVKVIHSPVAGLKKGRKPVTGLSNWGMIIGPWC
jgi:hypothetical protein